METALSLACRQEKEGRRAGEKGEGRCETEGWVEQLRAAAGGANRRRRCSLAAVLVQALLLLLLMLMLPLQR